MGMIGQLLAGRYLILESLGIGGFSATYLARDKYLPDYPLCVVKRLQVPPDSPISPEVAQQLFASEARLLDQLGQQHAQIPALLAYCQEPEEAYLVQAYIVGETLESWIARGLKLTPAAAIALLLNILPVLDYVHSQNVIHHDIKPSNLIYRAEDGKVVLIDFGAACMVSESGVSCSVDSALAIGTPGYMSAEQDQGVPQFNSDLYALGMLVIHLLTGANPRQFQRDPISGEMDWRRYLNDTPIDPRLEAILNQMVQISFRDRYQQASDVLAALQALPQAADGADRATTLPTSARWFVSSQRQVIQQLLKATVGLLLLAGAGGGYAYLHPQQTETLLARWHLMTHGSEMRLQALYDLAMPGPVDQMLIAPNNQTLVTAGSDRVLRLWSLTNQGAKPKTLTGSTGAITALAMSSDSRRLVSGSADSRVRLWDVKSGKLLRTFREPSTRITAVAMSPDGKTIVCGNQAGQLRWWNARSGTLLRTLTLSNAAVSAVTFGPQADQVIIASSDRQIQVWNLETGNRDRTFTGHTAAIVGLQVIDDHTLISFGHDRALVWDLKRQALTSVLPKESATTMAASFSQHNIVTVDDKGEIRRWTAQTGVPLAEQIGTLGNHRAVALSPNHRFLAGLGNDQRLRVWRLNPKTNPKVAAVASKKPQPKQ
jgi:Protein kinase domain/WD domain, G-beta repeat